MEFVFLVHVAATWAMIGLIWFVQVVHYPLFTSVGPDQFVGYEARHTRRTGWVVAVLMPVEAGTGLWLALNPPEQAGNLVLLIGLALIALLWITTLLWQVPLHRHLSAGYQPGLVSRLVRSNWARTVIWSVRGLLVLAVAADLLD